MTKVITIATQKGGVGKTTTAAQTAAGLALNGYRTLAIDMDTQGNLSYIFGAKAGTANIFDILANGIPAAQAIQHTPATDLIAYSTNNATLDTLLARKKDKGSYLRQTLKPIIATGYYDYIVIDTPPALGVITINALTAADYVVIPAEASIFSLQGTAALQQTINAIMQYSNPELKIAGILLTKYNSRAALARQIAEYAATLAQDLNTKVFTATIRRAIAIEEAAATQQDIFTYAPRSNVAGDYRQYVAELIAATETK